MSLNVHMTGFNLLVDAMGIDEKTKSGLYIPDKAKEKVALVKGTVMARGPGFMVPIQKGSDSEMDAIIQGTDPRIEGSFISLDVNVGDTVYFPPEASDEVRLDDKVMYVVSYLAVKLFIKKQMGNR